MHGYTRYPTILRYIMRYYFFYTPARERVSRVPAKKVTETIIYRFDLIAYRRTYYNNLLDTAVVTYIVRDRFDQSGGRTQVADPMQILG